MASQSAVRKGIVPVDKLCPLSVYRTESGFSYPGSDGKGKMRIVGGLFLAAKYDTINQIQSKHREKGCGNGTHSS